MDVVRLGRGAERMGSGRGDVNVDFRPRRGRAGRVGGACTRGFAHLGDHRDVVFDLDGARHRLPRVVRALVQGHGQRARGRLANLGNRRFHLRDPPGRGDHLLQGHGRGVRLRRGSRRRRRDEPRERVRGCHPDQRRPQWSAPGTSNSRNGPGVSPPPVGREKENERKREDLNACRSSSQCYMYGTSPHPTSAAEFSSGSPSSSATTGSTATTGGVGGVPDRLPPPPFLARL